MVASGLSAGARARLGRLILLPMTAIPSVPQVPWFSGLCPQGELAGQDLLESEAGHPAVAGHGQNQPAGHQAELGVDGLAPITIFAGANNSEKSRLMRAVFCTEHFHRFILSINAPEEGTIELTKFLVGPSQAMSIDGIAFHLRVR